ncbi:MAG: chloride channel protein [Bacteroidales bacterium]|nr:chloride channel protein [Bacteroidales bacterium]
MKFKRLYFHYAALLRQACKERLGIRTTVLLLSFFTGIFGAAAAIVIKNLLFLNVSFLNRVLSATQYRYIYLAFPLIGIILTIFFVKHFVKDDISHGVSIVLKAISKSSGKLRSHNIYSSIVASSLTVGFGGSVGLEAPIVLTGSAIGSNLGKLFNLSRKETTLLLACGSTAAMAAIFKAPVAAIVFALEVLMLDMTNAALLPLLISAATGTVMSMLFLGANVMFTECNLQAFNMSNIPFYILLGLLSGALSIYFLRMLRIVERLFSKIRITAVRVVVGGLALGLLIFIFPVFYGEGYENISMLLQPDGAVQMFSSSPLAALGSNYWIFLLFMVAILLFKVFATAFTTGAGGNGGVFAPSLFVGAFLGALLALSVNHFTSLNLPVNHFVLAGMSGLMAGIMHAPLTAIFLIAELSTGYNLLIPLMITASISYLSVRPFERYSVYARQLAGKGILRTHNKDVFAIRQLNIMRLIDRNIATIYINSTLREYTNIVANSKRNIFVVLDNNDDFAGLLLMDEHREMLFRQDLYDLVIVKDLMYKPDVVVYDSDSGEEIVRKFRETKNFNLPVITKDNKYVGFLSKANVLTAYREVIASESED